MMNLQVRDFAIVEKIDIEFEPGMTVLTGETGAGKSILVDALGLVLGERGGAHRCVRVGAEEHFDRPRAQPVLIRRNMASIERRLNTHCAVRYTDDRWRTIL